MTTSLINAFNQIGLATTGATNSATGANSSTKDISGTTQSLTQSDFLTLLTTQLTHQDPTSPTDSNAFISQMAQFSTVTGIQNLLSSFQTLSSSLTSDQSLQAANLVGKTVSVPAKSAYLTSGGSVIGDFTLASSTSNARVTVTNPTTGAVVDQFDMGAQAAGNVPFTWKGVDLKGNQVASGVYNIQVTALVNGSNTAVTTNIQSLVDSVSLGSGGSGLQVNLQNGNSVPFSKVLSII